jgi:glutamine amidotransferase
MMIGVIDYGMGNVRSVLNALESLSRPARLMSDPGELREASGIILPGVGAFGDGMRNLRERGLVEPLEREVLREKKPFLGICLGLQLLATLGLEHGRHEGLNWVKGVVDRLSVPEGLRIPHIGWNDVRVQRKDGLYRGIGEAGVFYFVHSYALRPEDPGIVSGTTDYGTPFVASIERDNLTGTQFHPEKSHKTGLQVLANWCGSC